MGRKLKPMCLHVHLLEVEGRRMRNNSPVNFPSGLLELKHLDHFWKFCWTPGQAGSLRERVLPCATSAWWGG